MRFLPHTLDDVREMLDAVGISTIDELFQPIPTDLTLDRPLAIAEGLDEMTLDNELKSLAERVPLDNAWLLQTELFDNFVEAIGALRGAALIRWRHLQGLPYKLSRSRVPQIMSECLATAQVAAGSLDSVSAQFLQSLKSLHLASHGTSH